MPKFTSQKRRGGGDVMKISLQDLLNDNRTDIRDDDEGNAIATEEELVVR